MSVYSLKESAMYIRKALFVYLLLESLARSQDWEMDWRWFSDLSEADQAS